MKRTRPNSAPTAASEIPFSRRILYATLVLSVPVIFLAFLEVGLRIGGYGPDLRLFVPRTIGGTEYYGVNVAVTSRYFPSLHVQPGISSDLFHVHKLPGTIRVFCLGESSTLGYPFMYNGSFPAILREELALLYPERPVEVVNLGVTAVSSYTVAEFGRWCLDFEPDVLVVYTGHNEYYGALGVASTESVGRVRWFVRTYLALHEWKTFLLVKSLIGRLRGNAGSDSPERKSGTLMEALAREKDIPFGSSLYQEGLDQFAANIGSLLEAAQRRSVPVVLSTLTSNLRDLEPLRTVLTATSPGFDRTAHDAAIVSFRNMVVHGKALDVREQLRVLANADTGAADIAFLLGRANELAEDYASAQQWYARARDLDALRFRGSSDLNELIRTLAKTYGMPVAEPEQIMQRRSRYGLIGSRFLLEHVHPTLEGYGILAEAMLDPLLEVLPKAGRAAVSKSSKFRAVVTPVDTIAASMRIDILVHSWPFTVTNRSLSDLRAGSWEESLSLGFLRRELTWEEMHVRAAERYESDAKWDAAANEYRALIAATPYNVSPFLRLGGVLLQHGRRDDAKHVYEASLKIEETSQARLKLAQYYFDSENYADAARELRSALSLGQLPRTSLPDIRLALVTALLRSGDLNAAGGEAEKLAAEYPSYQPAQGLRDEVRRRLGGPGR